MSGGAAPGGADAAFPALPLRQRRTYGKWFATEVVRTIRDHGMIADGETVAVALSGGKDSAALLVVLDYLRRCSPLRFDLLGVHVRMGEYDTAPLASLCAALAVPYAEVALEAGRLPPRKSVCALCARLKRGAMAGLLRERGIRRLAFGHHADDAAETLLMNLVHARRVIGLAPRVSDGGEVEVIRPLIRLPERTLASLHGRLGLPLLSFSCPHDGKTERARAKAALAGMGEVFGVRDLGVRVARAVEGGGACNFSGLGCVAPEDGESSPI